MSDEVKCLVCGEDAFEIQLCRDHYDAYMKWKYFSGDQTGTNKVAEWMSVILGKFREALVMTREASASFRARESTSGRGPGDAGVQLANSVDEWFRRVGLGS